MKSNFEQSELLALIEHAGMRQELEDRVEARKLEKRRELISERGRLLKERDTVLPALEAAAIEARENVAVLEQKLAAAIQIMKDTEQRAYGTRSCYGTAQIDAEIERNAPKFMQDAFDILEEPINFLQGAVRFRPQRLLVGWGFRTIDMSNTEEIAALQRKCRQGRDEVRQMMFDDETPTGAQRARCTALVQECVALTHPHLKDDGHWLAQQERKARTMKSA